MDKHTGQRPFTDEDLAQALHLGTEAAARRQSALRAGVLAQVQAPERRRPLWHTLAASAAAVLLIVAALLALANLLPQRDVVQPLATRVPKLPSITLTTDILRYSPLSSAAQGIAFSAWDNSGKLLTGGTWKTSWGVFLGSVSEQGNLIPRNDDRTDTLQYSGRALWSFAQDAGRIPLDITVIFTAPDGRTATLHMVPDEENHEYVHVIHAASSIRFRGKGFCININPSLGGQVEPLVVEAVDQSGTPVNGTWFTSFGTIHAENGTLDNGSKVSWTFAAKTADDVPDNAQLFFATADGRCQVLELTKSMENPFALSMSAQQAGEFIDSALTYTSDLRLRTDKSGVNADPSRNAATLPLMIQAEYDITGPVRGTWSANFGQLSVKSSDLTGPMVENADSVLWSFSAAAAKDIPDTVEITFTAQDGHTKTLHLKKYPDQPWTLMIAPEELDYYPPEPSPTQPMATASATLLPTASPTAEASLPPPLLPPWTMDVHYDGPNMALAIDAHPKKYLAIPTQWQDQETPYGSLRLPKGWSVSGSQKDIWLKLLDASGQEMGTLEYNWLDASLGQEAYRNALSNHTELISFQKLQWSSCPAYRLLLEADNGTAASGIPGVTIQSETVFLPGTILQQDGNYYYEVYILQLYKARTGDGDTKYLLNNPTIDAITSSWKEPQTGTSPQQAIEAFFESWDKKNLAAMNACMFQPLAENIYMEFDELKSIRVLDCSDVTNLNKAFTKWPSGIVDTKVFQVTFDVQYRNGPAGAMSNGTNHQNFYLVKEPTTGHWFILTWGN